MAWSHDVHVHSAVPILSTGDWTGGWIPAASLLMAFREHDRAADAARIEWTEPHGLMQWDVGLETASTGFWMRRRIGVNHLNCSRTDTCRAGSPQGLLV